jgi:hypothetical protein
MPNIETATFTYTPSDLPSLTFAWSGGPYIDVYRSLPFGIGEIVDSINVWNPSTNRPIIDVSQEAFKLACAMWLSGRVS